MGRPMVTHCKGCGVDLSLNPIYYYKYGVRTRRSRCRECLNAHQRELNESNPSGLRDAQLKYRFKFSLEGYNKLLVAQGGVCAICKQICVTGKDLAVDHNHVTGEIRGLVCLNCNQAMGSLKEDPNIIMALYDYLERTTWKSNAIPKIRPVPKKEEAS